MKIEQSANELIFSGFNEFIAGLLNQITICSNPTDSPKAAERLFIEPSIGEAELNEDWKEFVHPDLKHLFQSANEVVNGDLAAIEQTAKRKMPEFRLRIPLNHAESWLSSLNQARLALAAIFELTEEDMDAELPQNISSERELALFQIHLYGFVQEHLIQTITGDE